MAPFIASLKPNMSTLQEGTSLLMNIITLNQTIEKKPVSGINVSGLTTHAESRQPRSQGLFPGKRPWERGWSLVSITTAVIHIL